MKVMIFLRLKDYINYVYLLVNV